MFIVRALWTGFPGSPGYSNLAFGPSDPGLPTQSVVDINLAAVHDFFNGLVNYIPVGSTIQVEQTVRVVNPADGSLAGFVTGSTAPAPINSNASPENYNPSSGALVEWITASVVGNRAVRGKTFMIPLVGSTYGHGVIADSVVTSLRGSASGLLAATAGETSSLGVWARPRKAYTSRSGVAHPARAGAFAKATGSSVSNKPAVLRSRRD